MALPAGFLAVSIDYAKDLKDKVTAWHAAPL